MTCRWFTVLVAGIAFCATVRAGDVENPEYAGWAKFKPGTTVTVRTTVGSSDKDGVADLTKTEVIKLIEVARDKVVLEVKTEVVVPGTKVAPQVEKRTVEKNLDTKLIKAAEKAAAARGDKAAPKPEQGEEVVKVSGVEYKSKWFKVKSKTDRGEVVSQTWVSEYVPTQVIKSVISTKGKTTVVELLDLKKP
jgi:hypothetical protein